MLIASAIVDFPEPISPVTKIFLLDGVSDHIFLSNVPQLNISNLSSLKPVVELSVANSNKLCWLFILNPHFHQQYLSCFLSILLLTCP